MIIKDKKTNKNIYLRAILPIVLVVALVGGAAYAYWLNSETGKQAQSDAAQKATDTQNKKDFIENTDDKGSETPGQTQASEPPKDPDNIVILTREETNSSVTITVKLIGYSDGQCTLDITNGNNKHNEVAAVIFQPEYSTCAGFSVDKSVLGGGAWNIRLKVTSKGVDVTKQQTVVVK